jgi:N-acetylglucosaminyldiphosphoundecaprenol N-acetyl-beta-D-mannosaminyltransferase
MEKFSFFEINIAITHLEEVKNYITSYDFSNPGYICFPDSYVIALSQSNSSLKAVINSATLALPDGKPIALLGKRKGLKNIDTVSGYWLCKALLDTSLSHYFLGSTTERLKKIIEQLYIEHPDAKIKGYSSPKFISEGEAISGSVLEEEFRKINELSPDLIWIGISSPKQDYVMHNHLPFLKHGLMLGVGGVFDYLSGDIKKKSRMD